MRLIKSIQTDKFEISLVERDNHKYQIIYVGVPVEPPFETEPGVSEMISDYKTADFLFDVKLRELEGN